MTPIAEEIDYSITVVENIVCDSGDEVKEEIEEENDENQSEQSNNDNQSDMKMAVDEEYEQEILDAVEFESTPKSNINNDSHSISKSIHNDQLEPDDEEIKNKNSDYNMNSSDKKKSEVCNSTPTKPDKQSKTPNKTCDVVKSSQTSLSNLFEMQDSCPKMNLLQTNQNNDDQKLLENKLESPTKMMHKIISSQSLSASQLSKSFDFSLYFYYNLDKQSMNFIQVKKKLTNLSERF